MVCFFVFTRILQNLFYESFELFLSYFVIIVDFLGFGTSSYFNPCYILFVFCDRWITNNAKKNVNITATKQANSKNNLINKQNWNRKLKNKNKYVCL